MDGVLCLSLTDLIAACVLDVHNVDKIETLFGPDSERYN